MNTYAYSETFMSVQGEGRFTGVPTLWLRFFLCNLQCDGFGQKDPTNPDTWKLPYANFDAKSVQSVEDLPVWEFGCDSSYSWAAKFKHLQKKKTAVEIVDELTELLVNVFNPRGKFLHPLSGQEQHMCFTGGEPLMPHGQKAVVEILREFKNQDNLPKFITFETNGTQALTDEFVEAFNTEFEDVDVFFSISPKLFTVTGEAPPKAIQPHNVASYTDILGAHGQLKFVLGGEQRMWTELDSVIPKFRNAGVDFPVWIMPVGATEEAQQGQGGYASAGDVAEMAYQRGYNVSARVHCYLWGNKIGV